MGFSKFAGLSNVSLRGLSAGAGLSQGSGLSFDTELSSSQLTWDASSDTYSQAIYTEQSSQLTWDASTDTYSQSLFS